MGYEAAYWAGFFDGEGCVTIESNGKTSGLRCILTNTDLEVLLLAQKRYGGALNGKSKGKDNWKQSYHLRLRSVESKPFLEDILPYLIIKKERVVMALEYIEKFSGRGNRNPESREPYINRMKEFNKRGVENVCN